jgi:polyisoprenoid-binding protein YceI
MSKKVLRWAIPAVVVVAIALLAGWWFLIRDTSPEEANLEDAVASVTTAEDGSTEDGSTTTAAEGSSGTDGATTTSAAAAASTTAAAADGVTGTWAVSERDGVDLFAGFRIDEELAGVGGKTVVGRTDDVEATVVIDGTTVTAADIVVDATTLATDSSSRDRALRDQGLETTRFPEVTFTLTEPIELGAVPADGEVLEATANGELTIHGVTNPVSIPLQGQLVDGVLVVTGSAPIVLADYDITKPQAAVVLSIEDEGALEFQLFLERS